MKRLISIFMLGIIFLTNTGCQNTTTADPNQDILDQGTAITTIYPINNVQELESIYPSGDIPETKVPEYLLPGFITATPDPELAPIVISEIKHEDDVEIIVIKNISDKEIDISAYMIFSPEAGDRKILPNDLMLSSGETFQIFNGENLNVPQEQIWLSKSILVNPLDEIWLLNKAARIVYYFTYYPTIPE